MEFKFNYSVKPKNLLLLAMQNIYNSFTGIINIVFTTSMVLLLIRFWPENILILRILIIIGIFVFPLFQPLIIYLKSRRIVSTMPNDMEMTISDNGIDIKTGNINRVINYSELVYVKKHRDMIIFNTKSNQGYFLNRETLNGFKDELYNIIKGHIK